MEPQPLLPYEMEQQAEHFQNLLALARRLRPGSADVEPFIKRLNSLMPSLNDQQFTAVDLEARKRLPYSPEAKLDYAINNAHLGTRVAKVLESPRRPSRPERKLNPDEKRRQRRELRYETARGRLGMLIPLHISRKVAEGIAACLNIVAREILDYGVCTLYVNQIGNRGGCGVRTARAALREGEELGLIVTEFRREGARNQTNLVRPTPLLRSWLKGRKRFKEFIQQTDSGDPSIHHKDSRMKEEK